MHGEVLLVYVMSVIRLLHVSDVLEYNEPNAANKSKEYSVMPIYSYAISTVCYTYCYLWSCQGQVMASRHRCNLSAGQYIPQILGVNNVSLERGVDHACFSDVC